MNTKEILNAFPQPEGKILRNIDKEACERAVEQIISGGRKITREIIDLILEPGNGDDIRPRHAIHATAIRVGGTGKEIERNSFASALASTLNDDRPKAVKGFVIRQLQICGGAKQAEAIAHFLNDSEEHLYEYSAQALEVIGGATIEYFRTAYPSAKGAPRITILQGLGLLQDKKSRPFFLSAMQDTDLEIRLAGIWGLMRISSAKDAELMLSQSLKEKGWGRIKATAYCFELAEKLAKNDQSKEAKAIYIRIKKSHSEKQDAYLRETADRGLVQLK
ncbi:MAG: HEAT repeat domain-containing protein [Opitutales bacterium]|nr:HEAT repeat domain-containing protein [Opitutales bacterium]